jgi:hypothetical protein
MAWQTNTGRFGPGTSWWVLVRDTGGVYRWACADGGGPIVIGTEREQKTSPFLPNLSRSPRSFAAIRSRRVLEGLDQREQGACETRDPACGVGHEEQAPPVR